MQLVHGKTHLKKFASRTVLSILHLSIGTVQFRALILPKMMCCAMLQLNMAVWKIQMHVGTI